MPPRPFKLSFGPFDRGLMNGLDPSLLPPGAAQTCQNVDLSKGTLRGIYTPSATPATFATALTADLRSIAFVGNDQWIGTTIEQWTLADYDITNASSTSLATKRAMGVAAVPDRYKGGTTNPEDLGLEAPGDLTHRSAEGWLTNTAYSLGAYCTNGGKVYVATTGGTSAASTGPTGTGTGIVDNTVVWDYVAAAPQINAINKRYAVTYLYGDGLPSAGLGWESNPGFTPVAIDITGQVVLTLPVSADGRVTGRNVYCTNNGDPNGPLYLYSTAFWGDKTSTSFTDTLGTNPTGALLDWAEEGSYDTPIYLFDHAEPPGLSLLSDSLHSAVPGVTAPGGSIAVGANGQVAYWSQAGFVHHWPKRNRWSAPEAIRAILSHNAQSLLFTGSGVYGISGTDDNNLSFSKLAADAGVRAACGKTVCRTPFGVVYLSRQGLMLLNGDGAQPFLRDALSPDFWDDLTPQATSDGGFVGAGYGRQYYVFGGDKTVILDFTHWPTVAVSTSDIVITAAHVTQFDGAGSGQGLYVAKHADRNGSNQPYIRPWMYDNANARGTQAAWIWKTGRLAAVRPGSSQAADKKGTKLHIRKTGTPTVKIYYDGSIVSTRTLGTAVGEGSTWIWLPTGYWKYMEIQIEGAGASDEVFGFDVEGAVFDAA